MKNNVLIIYDSIDFFIPFMVNENIDVDRLYKKKGPLITIIKRIFLKLNLFNKSWYNNWIYNIEKYDIIIVFATQDYTFLNWIKKNHPKKKIIMWYWNPTFRMGIPKSRLSSIAEVWSFDKNDCIKYQMKFNTTFYFSKIKLPSVKNEYEILFLGIDKGRRNELEAYNLSFNNMGINSYFHIVPDKKDSSKYKEKPLPYPKYLELVAKSKAILDIKPINQDGLTLRPMEAIFFRKKLITTDTSIVKETFYSNKNVFVLGTDDINKLKDFLNEPYENIDESIILHYDFDNWLKRLINE